MTIVLRDQLRPADSIFFHRLQMIMLLTEIPRRAVTETLRQILHVPCDEYLSNSDSQIVFLVYLRFDAITENFRNYDFDKFKNFWKTWTSVHPSINAITEVTIHAHISIYDNDDSQIFWRSQCQVDIDDWNMSEVKKRRARWIRIASRCLWKVFQVRSVCWRSSLVRNQLIYIMKATGKECQRSARAYLRKLYDGEVSILPFDQMYNSHWIWVLSKKKLRVLTDGITEGMMKLFFHKWTWIQCT